MSKNEKMLDANREIYEDRYSKDKAFLRYPADWIVRFHNIYMKKNVPDGRVLDYGCGSGNNSVFFMDKGYETWGTDVAASFKDQVRQNMTRYGHREDLLRNFFVIPPDCSKLPFESGYFDLIVANQVLYYLSSAEQINKVTDELYRCLKPGGAVFFTMMGPGNCYIKYFARQIHSANVYEVRIDEPGHRLYGFNQFIYVVRDRDELKKLFGRFEPLDIGYFDQSIFDMKSNFHWIFVGRKGKI